MHRAIVSMGAGCVLVSCRDVTKEVQTAMHAVERAMGHAYEVAGELGLEGEGSVAVGQTGSLRDCSLREATHVFANWYPRSPSDVTAEYFHHGTYCSSYTVEL